MAIIWAEPGRVGAVWIDAVAAEEELRAPNKQRMMWEDFGTINLQHVMT
jgi:hypothetical protein